MCINLVLRYRCGHCLEIELICGESKCKRTKQSHATDDNECGDCCRKIDVENQTLRTRIKTIESNVRKIRANAIQEYTASLHVEIKKKYICRHEATSSYTPNNSAISSKDCRYHVQYSTRVDVRCGACQRQQLVNRDAEVQGLYAASRDLQRQVEQYELDLIETIEERDDVLQRLENEGIREVRDLRDTIADIRKQNEEYDLQATAFMAQQRERLAQMEAQNAEADTALLDLEEKLQIALLEHQMLHEKLKEYQETDTAVAATLAFAMVRSEGTAAAQDQDLDDASAEIDDEWWSENEENVEVTPDDNNKDSAVLSNDHVRHLAGVSEEVRSRDHESSPVTKTEDTHPCSTAVKEQDTTRKPSRPSKPPK
ncbi:hypothetical protein BU25DRAFT_485114 [Macroventuria anomochaeta]|uniref:Uncharacterized protein n=1 Tax=Macroventuria anomochaeta TaxID=301207 RepID=A0ACB6S764_9PLEO|nr:uncharacterized protein BU25DRAFT_485114 [Macroventuria anomochaeta]KAF2629981.1 hypothetical protein BU25DRAFT_485114 [Macroventuria anomochaeta]